MGLSSAASRKCVDCAVIEQRRGSDRAEERAKGKRAHMAERGHGLESTLKGREDTMRERERCTPDEDPVGSKKVVSVSRPGYLWFTLLTYKREREREREREGECEMLYAIY